MRIIIFFFLWGALQAQSQGRGGGSVYSFLNLPNSPQLAALGGVNISAISNDAGMVYSNPALLRQSMHSQFNFAFNNMYAGIQNISASGVSFNKKFQTLFSAGVNYTNYGKIPNTDPSGNELGEFSPRDYVVYISAARKYEERWHYGAALKWIYSGYGQYRSWGLAMDVGLSYTDTAAKFQAGLVAKTMGVQIRSYHGIGKDDLPFNLQLGISKTLKNAPLQFSLTVHTIQQLRIRYNDSAFNADNGFGNGSPGKFSVGDLLQHLVTSAQYIVAERVELSAGYNHLRRTELNIGDSGNGLNGFSAGIGVLTKAFQLRFARVHYQNRSAYHQLGLNIVFNQLMDL